jgi:hypothetical protein
MRPQENWAGGIVLAAGVGKQGQAWDILDSLAGEHWEEGRGGLGQVSASLPSGQPGRVEPCLSPSSLQTTGS